MKPKSIEINDTIVEALLKSTRLPSASINYKLLDKFRNNEFEAEMSLLNASPFKKRDKLYIEQNQNKLFISIDINKASYSIMKHYYSDIFVDATSWEDFVRSFCQEKPANTLIQSKPLRERIFGKTGITNKTCSVSLYFIHKVLHEMKCASDDIVMLSGDEAVLQYDFHTYHSMAEQYHGAFFKVLAFRLIKLPKYNYFVKEYFHPLRNMDDEQLIITRREFKCVPRCFIMQ